MKYKILVIRSLWVIILLLTDIIRMHEHDDLVALSIIIAKRYQDDLLLYAEVHE